MTARKQNVTIQDIADGLNLSVATISNVIHGKYHKVSEETVHRVLEELEKQEYFPRNASLLMGRNNSRMIGIAVHDHPKYEGKVFEDGFITTMLNALYREIFSRNLFPVLLMTKQWDEIPDFASIWNMEGLILLGFCEQDYVHLRRHMRIPLAIIGSTEKLKNGIGAFGLKNFEAGKLAGSYLRKLNHQKVLLIADNDTYIDKERMDGCICGLEKIPSKKLIVPSTRKERENFFALHEEELLSCTAVFAVSDLYAIEIIRFFHSRNLNVPRDKSVIGFDGSATAKLFIPSLTTLEQDYQGRAKAAVSFLENAVNDNTCMEEVSFPLHLYQGESCAAFDSQDQQQ